MKKKDLEEYKTSHVSKDTLARAVAARGLVEFRPRTTEQAVSTLRAEAETLEEKRNRAWPPANWRANPHAKTHDEAVGMAARWRMEDGVHAESVRRAAKNSAGQSEESGAAPTTKDRAESAFRFSPPATAAEVEGRPLTGLAAYVSNEPAPEPFFGLDRTPRPRPPAPELTRSQKIRNWLLRPFFAWLPESWKDD